MSHEQKPEIQYTGGNMLRYMGVGLIAGLTGMIALSAYSNAREQDEQQNFALDIATQVAYAAEQIPDDAFNPGPTIEAHEQTASQLTEILLENNLLLDPVCSDLKISVPYSDIVANTGSPAIDSEIRMSDGNTEVAVCIDSKILENNGTLTTHATTNPTIAEGQGRTSVYLTLQEPSVLPHCTEAFKDMAEQLAVRVDEINSIHTTNVNTLKLLVDSRYDHPCDSNLTIDKEIAHE